MDMIGKVRRMKMRDGVSISEISSVARFARWSQKVALWNVFQRSSDVSTKSPSRKAYEAVSAARSDLDTYIDWYNRERVHSRIEDRTPEQAYWALLPELAVAA